MRHAGPATLDQLEPLLVAIRRCRGLREKSRGVFYLKTRALLHFHEDPAGLFADLRSGNEWQRLPVTTAVERKVLLARVKFAATNG